MMTSTMMRSTRLAARLTPIFKSYCGLYDRQGTIPELPAERRAEATERRFALSPDDTPEKAMSRESLSRPPNDAALLHDTVHDVLSGYPPSSILPMTVLLSAVRAQFPDTISNDDIVREIALSIGQFGFAVQFDKRP